MAASAAALSSAPARAVIRSCGMPALGELRGGGPDQLMRGRQHEVPARVGLLTPRRRRLREPAHLVDCQNDIHGGRGIDPMDDAVQTHQVRELDVCVDADALEMLGDRRGLGQVGIRLGLLAPGRRRGVGAPVIKDPGKVRDPVGALHQPQDEVVVLAAVEARSEAPQLDRQLAPVDAQVARVHHRRHVLRRPPGLDVTRERPIVGHHLLVAVEHVERGVDGDAMGDVLQSVGGEGVVVVQ